MDTKVNYNRKPSNYQKYIELGNWKCPDSPNGAHHWVITGERGKCKHCHTERMFDGTPILQGDVHQLDYAPTESKVPAE